MKTNLKEIGTIRVQNQAAKEKWIAAEKWHREALAVLKRNYDDEVATLNRLFIERMNDIMKP